MRLVVTGRDGQVTRALQALAGPDLEVVALGRDAFDLAAEGDATAVFAQVRPDVIVNAGAYTAVDKAESERELAFAVNGRGAGRVARAAAALNVPVIQISTDYVFDGSGEKPWRESDAVGPLGAYGASKSAGEEAVRAATPNHAILRTSWVYAPWGANFVKTMLRLAQTRPELQVVADQWGAPTSALDIAQGVVAVARNLLARPHDETLRGVFHMTAQGETTWADFAREIFAQSAAHGGASANVVSIPTSGYPTPAKRPPNSRLSTQKLADTHGVRLPHWRDGLKRVMAAMAEGERQSAASLG
ncbi:dTDP-4-dehydrorhamnose reductase [Rhodoblastus acidophilus]|uniref:dTDP-4-dehydrorhamnose reductase n=1 Tax=Rhodoblastus acidophilus TaxID=1074 RepID=UPI0022249DEB|nr:dTDP-4-dehydrorhamnose reductase [Rhodoblastus acidophilus]MCW2284376.1 dTDP-4-dehydrorhamnose reductase [Rhodoblastus acidophilus]MCW2333146.1 dTDP-4-dehydrorhamnose reductase [Rhodoblastus acidophilus]